MWGVENRHANTDSGVSLSDPQLGSSKHTAHQTHPGLMRYYSATGPLITILSSGLQRMGLGDALVIAANESHKRKVKEAEDAVL